MRAVPPPVVVPAAPRLPDALHEQVACGAEPGSRLADETTVTASRVGPADLGGLTGGWLSVEGCVLDRITMASSVLTSASLTDVVLERCDLSNVDLRGASLLRVRLVGCRLTGMSLAEARLQHVVLEGCLADLLDVRFARLDRVRFADTALREADLYAAELRRVAFPGADLSRAQVAKAQVDRVDLRGARLDEVRGIGDLAGAIVDADQLITLAPLLAADAGFLLAAEE